MEPGLRPARGFLWGCLSSEPENNSRCLVTFFMSRLLLWVITLIFPHPVSVLLRAGHTAFPLPAAACDTEMACHLVAIPVHGALSSPAVVP